MDVMTINNPSLIELDDAYRTLKKHEALHISTSTMAATLEDLEKIGFVGMVINRNSVGDDAVIILAYKGKHGPCHFEASTAIYTGNAIAALDDDLHLLIKDSGLHICEKTRGVLSLPPYQSTLKCQSEIKPEHSDFDANVSFISETLEGVLPSEGKRVAVFYGGPFRLLILQDGTIVRRGRCNSVPEELASMLMAKENCFRCHNADTISVEFFQHQYAERGTLFLSQAFSHTPILEIAPVQPDMAQLHKIHEPLRKRLIQVIATRKKYFILIGSDMDDPAGCCPSQEVTDANRLARSGILSAMREKAIGESCPVTLLAFRDELIPTEEGFKPEINEPFRAEIMKHLKKRNSTFWKITIQLTLLLFLLISIVFAVKRCADIPHNPAGGKDVIEILNPMGKSQIQVVLFHNQKRCHQCLELERMTKEVLNEYFDGEIASGKLSLRTIVMDEPLFTGLALRYRLYSATIVIIVFDGEKIISEQPLFQTGSHYRDEAVFKSYLKEDIHKTIKQQYD